MNSFITYTHNEIEEVELEVTFQHSDDTRNPETTDFEIAIKREIAGEWFTVDNMAIHYTWKGNKYEVSRKPMSNIGIELEKKILASIGDGNDEWAFHNN